LTETGWFARITADDLSRLREFNAAPLRIRQSSALLGDLTFPLGDADTAFAGRLSDLIGWVGPPFLRADILSRRFQLLYLRLSGALFVLAASPVGIVALQLVFFPDVRLAVIGEIACLIAIIGALEWGRRRHVLQRWISTRYLAERLRNALFIALAGGDEQLSATPLATDEDPAAPWAQAAFHLVWIRAGRRIGMPLASVSHHCGSSSLTPGSRTSVATSREHRNATGKGTASPPGPWRDCSPRP
jgi:hypothetical protein